MTFPHNQLPLELFHLIETFQVLLTTCTNNLKARILIAYFDGKNLIVSKSALHDFSSPEARERNFPLFLLYMCSQAVGDTKALPVPMATEEHVTD